jgi:hypothetical protein
MSYSFLYEKGENNLTGSDLAKNKFELTTDKGSFANFLEVAKINAEETFRTSSIIAEQFNEREQWNENDKAVKDHMSEENYYGAYQRYKQIDVKRLTQIKGDLQSGTLNFDSKDKSQDYIDDVRAVEFYETLINSNTQLKAKTKEQVRQKVVKDIESLRTNKLIKETQQGSLLGEFVGGFAGMIADPVNLASLFIPVVGQAKNASLLMKSLNFGAKTALVEGSIEGFNQFAAVVPYRRNYLGDNYTNMDALGAVTMTALGSFVLGGGIIVAGDIAKGFMKGKDVNNRTAADKIIDEYDKVRGDNTEKLTASDIQAAESLRVMNNKISKAEDEFQDANLKAFDKATHDLVMGKGVDIEDITDPIRKKLFNKVIDDISLSKNIKDVEKLYGKELAGYFKDNNVKIKKDLETKSVREFFNDLQSEFDNRIVFENAKPARILETQEVSNKKIDQIVKRDGTYSETQLEDFNLTLNNIDNTIDVISKEKGIEPIINELNSSKNKINKFSKEQEELLNMKACLLNNGAKNV